MNFTYSWEDAQEDIVGPGHKVRPLFVRASPGRFVIDH
jgi:hypothetical protein